MPCALDVAMAALEDQWPATDVWYRWLLHGRNAGDAGFERILRSDIQLYVDRILDQAKLEPGMTLLDVGTGEGTVAFRAIERFGPTLRL